MLEVVKTLEYFRHYLIGKPFILETDHRALEYLWSTENTNSRLLRWALKPQEFSFTPKYIKGEDNAADGLSRPERDGEIVRSIKDESTLEIKGEILKEYHEISRHGSINTIEFMIRLRYNWIGLHKDIRENVEKCPVCIRAGDERINKKKQRYKNPRT